MLDFSVTFVITVINIVILFFILRALLFKRVTKFMADRAQKVQNSIDQAEQRKADAQKLLAKYEDQLKTANSAAEEILKNAREAAAAEAGRIIVEGKAAAEVLVANTKRQLETEQKALLAQFKSEAAGLVMLASSKLIERELSGDDNRRYANMLLEELAAQKENN